MSEYDNDNTILRNPALFVDMSDWCMAKDYNGAESFIDGSRPLIAETQYADIII